MIAEIIIFLIIFSQIVRHYVYIKFVKKLSFQWGDKKYFNSILEMFKYEFYLFRTLDYMSLIGSIILIFLYIRS